MATTEERFGANVRRMRINAKMTQTELAQRLGYSEKAVSKWERGASVPAASVLIEIARLFNARLDDLFKADGVYLLGIDGGATKTHLILSDCDMNILREYKTDSCNPIDIGIDECKRVLKDAILKICEGIPLSSTVMFAGISGGSSSDMKEKLGEFFKGLGFLDYRNDSDNMNTLAAGLGGEDGVAVIMGTGICAFSQKNGEHKRVAGWGYLFDDGGSAYNIGRDGLAAYFRSVDGTGENSYLTESIRERHPEPQALLGLLYEGGKRTVASYSKTVYDAAKQSDRAALEILKRNMAFAANAIRSAARGLEADCVKVVIAGGLASEDLTLELLREALGDDGKYCISALGVPPAHGALALAKQLYNER